MARSGGSQRSGKRRPSARKGRTKNRWPARVFGGAVAFLLVVAGVLFFWSLRDGAVVGNREEAVHITVQSTDKAEVVQALEAAGLLEYPTLTEIYAVWLTPGWEFQVRPHLLSGGLSARELVQRLAGVGSRDRVTVTIPEGWNHRQIAKRLESFQVCSELGFQAAVFDRETLGRAQLSSNSAEGYLFPATYQFYVDSDPSQVVLRLVSEARARLKMLGGRKDLPAELKRLKFKEHQVVTLASVVEKETGRAAEAPRVARVFLNRLRDSSSETRGRLQSDPTAAYGCVVEPLTSPSCAGFAGKITPRMLDDASNPYNTYRHAGLPPGPVSNPGERALRAVLRPAEGNDLYFVADGKGGHQFSETYEQHRKAIEQLRAERSR